MGAMFYPSLFLEIPQALGWQDFGSKSGASVVAAATTSGATTGVPEETIAAPTGASFTIAKPDLSQMVRCLPVSFSQLQRNNFNLMYIDLTLNQAYEPYRFNIR